MVDLVEDIDPVLAARINAAAEGTRRKVAVASARAALEAFDLDRQPEVLSALRALDAGKFGPVPEQQALQAWAEGLDEVYFKAGDRYEKGAGSAAEYDRAFRIARAASALVYAFEAEPYEAVTHAVYEAYYAMSENIDPILAAVDPLL